MDQNSQIKLTIL